MTRRNKILSEIKKYVKQKGQVSLEEIAVHFGREPDVIQEMLAMLLRKGKIKQRPADKTGCNGCGWCQSGKLTIYYWEQR
ncbi:MAG: sugar metabolism transcriptional regulator [Desulfobacterales bacterium]|nr:MAG: sugar metabolism transcriptional regulator [Desulfobacterales bacterium]